jgi:hypothetical protein
MPIIEAIDAAEHICPFNDFQQCLGARCMAFSFTEQPYDEIETNNLVDDGKGGLKPSGEDPPAPDPATCGQGWEAHGPAFAMNCANGAKLEPPHGRAQRWRKPRKQRTGFCSRAENHHHLY